MKDNERPGGLILFCDEIRFSVAKSSRSPDLEDSLLLIYLSKSYIKPLGEMNK